MSSRRHVESLLGSLRNEASSNLLTSDAADPGDCRLRSFGVGSSKDEVDRKIAKMLMDSEQKRSDSSVSLRGKPSDH